ncbi:MAG TPA: lysozyme inhibitor LprI family protein, partial [Candidatus Wallbacteria bacterium]|nr:lysozyme inhibitor LprI family protein [Candidatus Wallbacteria bacterium]
YYKLLSGVLDKEGQANLKKSQLEWIKLRDADIKLIDSVYSKKEGTMYVPMVADSIMELTKKRALELKAYYELIIEK